MQDKKPSPSIYCVTVTTQINQHTKRLQKSATHYKIDLNILGKNQNYNAHG